MISAVPVQHAYAELDEVLLHYVTAGSGPPVVLLHGWPQTWCEWRHIIPALAQRYTVIAPDLRGLGDSSRPLQGYDKQTVANDIWQLVDGKLGHERFFLVGHDWGGPTAYALTAQHPEAVRRLVIVDVVIPGDGGDFSQGGRRWHHQFHMTPDLPEALTQGREDVYLAWFYRTFAYRPDAIERRRSGGVSAHVSATRSHAGRLCSTTALSRRMPPTIAPRRAHEAADAGAGDRRCQGYPQGARARGEPAPRRHRCAWRRCARVRALHPRGAARGSCSSAARFLCRGRLKLLLPWRYALGCGTPAFVTTNPLVQ